MKKIKIALCAAFMLLICLPSARAAVTSRDFFEMIERNDADGIRQAIRDGFDINGLYGEKHFLITPLRQAVMKAKPDIVRILLESGADTEIDSNGTSPLVMAAGSATALMPTNETPTRKADAMEILDLLLSHGADVNRVNTFGDSPLKYALMGRDYETSFVAAKKLLDAGAEINPILPPDKQTPLMWVVATAYIEWDSTGIRENRAGLVKFLIESGADVNASNDDGSVLHFAAAFDYELTKILLDAGADKNVKNKKGETPIDAALQFRNFKVIPLLLTY